MRVLMLVVLLGCGPVGTPISESCDRIGDQCRLREGLLGVCAPTTGDCEPPPCLECTPQH